MAGNLNDYLNTLGAAVHQASIASQALENELKAASDRVATLHDKNEKVKELETKIVELSEEVQQLTSRKNGLQSEVSRLLEKYK